MAKNDDDPVMFGFDSSRNISFRGEGGSGLTWGEWRKMNRAEKDDVIQDFVNSLIDVYVVGDED